MLHIDAHFPGGGVDRVRFPAPDVIQFEAPMDESPQSLWYAFRVRGAAGRRLTLRQTGLERVLGVFESRGYAPVIPVFREHDGDWQRVDEDGIVYSQDPLYFSFAITPRTDECFVAFCFPYQFSDWERFVRTLPAELIHTDVLGKTMEGRDFPRLLLGRPDLPSVRRMVVLSARQHAGEVSGSYALEGLLSRLTQPDMAGLLETTLFCVFPILDLDSVEEGRYGKDRFPADFNRDWKLNPYHPEIRLVQAELERLAARFRPVWGLDLHAPQPGGASYMPPSTSYPRGSELWRQTWNLGIAFEDHCRGKVSFHLGDVDTEVLNWGGVNDSNLIGAYYLARWRCPFNCFELSYHRDGELRPLTRQTWREMGALLAEALVPFALDDTYGQNPPDESRIPAWALPPVLGRWKTTRRTVAMQLDDHGDSLTLMPQAQQNFAWVTSALYSYLPQDRRAVGLRARGECKLKAYFSFFENGLLVRRTREEALAFTGEAVLNMPPPPSEVCSWAVSLIVEDLPADLCVEVPRHD